MTSVRARWRSSRPATRTMTSRSSKSALRISNRVRALHHFALQVGDSVNELAEVQRTLSSEAVAVHMALDHRVSQGLYVSDPDGNLIELYVDADQQVWRQDPSTVADSDPLSL